MFTYFCEMGSVLLVLLPHLVEALDRQDLQLLAVLFVQLHELDGRHVLFVASRAASFLWSHPLYTESLILF